MEDPIEIQKAIVYVLAGQHPQFQPQTSERSAKKSSTCINNKLLRLVPVGARRGAIPPGSGREAGDREAGRQRGAMDPSPGGSGRYRPAVARVGGERAARRRREWGGRRATRWRGGRRAGGGREGGGRRARRRR